MVFISYRKILSTDKYTHRVLWNQHWEKELKVYETFQQGKLPDPPFDHKAAAVTNRLFVFKSSDFDSFRRNIATLQADARGFALAHLTKDQFADKWTSLSPQTRMDHVLEALFQTCTSPLELEAYRTYCPDMTLEGLGREPRAFLDLLAVLVNGTDGELTTFPHPTVNLLLETWERSSAYCSDAVTFEKLRLDRMFFVSMVLWRILLSFYGKDQKHRIQFNGPEKSDWRKFREIRSTLTSPEEQEILAGLKRSMTAKDSKDRTTCWGCGRQEASLQPGTALQACAGCKRVGQRTLYCTRECQKNDWKNGAANCPPHKQTCGIPRKKWATECDFNGGQSFRVIPASTANIISNIIPPPDPGYKRSLELQYQISMLTQNPGDYPDYVLVRDHPHSDIGVNLTDRLIAGTFITARNRAFRNGDRAAVMVMWSFLWVYITGSPLPGVDIKKQLAKEFGVVLTEGMPREKFDPTDEETDAGLQTALLTKGTPIQESLRMHK
ncbi:hypothetical protein BXZ70DRAFT_1004070 [Cristinia sonorae]|uniref:MYND-type domain-containing protein n=1 Tax=Cristinia sonorae TaxID=1940300 RepID=A0A8K0UXY0_9AGAR|nr:hypothetical protein BXZ70DRAFT_1004070 [Cristinia sonorae]